MKKMNKLIIIGLLTALAASPLSLQARGNASAGQEKARACEACHGATGKSIDPTYPNLAGQYASYLEQALNDYRSGDRKNPIMAGMSAGLSDQDVEDLSAWFASQQGLQDISIK